MSETWTEKPCIDCGEQTLNDKRCRECNLDWLFTRNQCSGCNAHRFDRDAKVGFRGDIPATDIWGEPCACAEPLPLTVYERFARDSRRDSGLVEGKEPK